MEEDISKNEEKTLEFWRSKKVFEKSVKQREGKTPFIFYDGPPFATGRPHYGHLLPSTFKDTVLRYWTMQGYYVPRRVGWDCHGLPIENLAEQQLGLKGKDEIEKIGVDKFNQTCRKLVFRDLDIFQTTLQRLGRWADYENYYATMDSSYTESIWWVFKQLYQQGLIYKDYRVTPYCPRCGTPLSNFELNQPGAYRETKDTAVYFKVPLQGMPSTFLLVWTTTPWTIPANSAIAIQPSADYVKVKINSDILVLAKERLNILAEQNYQIIETLKGKDLVGKKYVPLYQVKPTHQEDHQVLGVEWVSVVEGTGLVHLAPSFGEDDMKVGQAHHLSTKITVDEQGQMIKGLGLPGEGRNVWEANEAIIQDLETRSFLFKQEIITHNYPFCWRCDTKLIYYPIDSWYVAVTKLQKSLLENNEKINWVPDYLKRGRFGRWLEGARDWSISRNRYWGAPLPVWTSSSETKVIGSRQELAQQKFSSNHYWLLRHPEAETNKQGILSSSEKKYPLTAQGVAELKKILPELKKKKIDFIFASPVRRTKETAEIVGQVLNLQPIFCKELKERNVGIFEEKTIRDYKAYFQSEIEKMTKPVSGGETGNETKLRIYNFLKKIDQEYKGKNILIISHQGPLKGLLAASQGLTSREIVSAWSSLIFNLAELRPLELKIFPYNDKGELDFHRPFIDEVQFFSQKGEKMKRVEVVFDCWFESGAMPYAQNHYPFENKKITEKNFPANFICESIDQTRGWFYTLNVLSAALTQKDIGLGKDHPAFYNVIVPGLVLSESGQKLSKHLKNFPDPSLILEKYGADALRLFFLTATALGNNYLVSDSNIQQVWRKVILTLWHSYQFYETYHVEQKIMKPEPKNILDLWIMSRLNGVNKLVVEKMKKYQADEAALALTGFIDDLSNWYIRRSRIRLQSQFSSEKEQASLILGYVLWKFSLMMAPFTPFISERIYQGLIGKDKKQYAESVHLNDYPQPEEKLISSDLEKSMQLTRDIVRLGLRLRAGRGLKVRQPLAELKIAGVEELDRQLLVLIQDELNVKTVSLAPVVKEEKGWVVYQENDLILGLNIEISPALKEEGLVREITHALQMMRKDLHLKPSQSVVIYYQSDPEFESFIVSHQKIFLEKNRALGIQRGEANQTYAAQKEFQIGSVHLWLALNQKK